MAQSFCRALGKLVRIGMLLVLTTFSAHAADFSPVGLWKTIDDNTGQPRGLVRVSQVNGEYQGKVEKIFPKSGEDPNPSCEKCDGTRRNQPVIGMTILWGQLGFGSSPDLGKIFST